MLERRLYVRREDLWRPCTTKKYIREDKCEIREIEEGFLLPPIRDTKIEGRNHGGIVDKNKKFVEGFSRLDDYKNPGYHGIYGAYEFDENNVNSIDETVIYGGVLIGSFGHFILESMSRLWFPCLHPEIKCKIVFLSILGKKGWFSNFFQLLGIDESRVVYIEEPTKVKHLIIPEESVHSWSSYKAEYIGIYRKITESMCQRNPRLAESPKKIFLVRGDSKNGVVCCNEEYFIEYFKKHGFVPINLLDYPLEDQIYLVHNADEIVTILGSLSHWALFSHSRAKWIVLTRVEDQVLTPQCLINEANSIDWYIIDVSLNFLFADRANGVCLLGVTDAFKEFAKNEYGDEITTNTLKGDLFPYISKWCERYSTKYVSYKRLENKTIFSLVDQMSRILFNKRIENRAFLPKKEFMKLSPARKNGLNELGIMFSRPLLVYDIHFSSLGWKSVHEKMICDGFQSSCWVEAIRLYSTDSMFKIFCSVRSFDNYWTRESGFGEIAGTTGKSLPITAVKVWLGNEEDKKYNVIYRVHQMHTGWSEWAMNGKICGEEHDKINAVQIFLDYK